ncbi:unnamed protein product [Menidia menidia]|uniref:(Atlantic silverside) hypothetical protein n=1 Tax=Menidia menidia TaxID=238744 RepID=A0A8S4ASD3_9TELE|nr:unnamed protein product [Menidia menidia]
MVVQDIQRSDVCRQQRATPSPVSSHPGSSSLRHSSHLKDWLMLIKTHRKSFRRKKELCGIAKASVLQLFLDQAVFSSNRLHSEPVTPANGTPDFSPTPTRNC